MPSVPGGVGRHEAEGETESEVLDIWCMKAESRSVGLRWKAFVEGEIEGKTKNRSEARS